MYGGKRNGAGRKSGALTKRTRAIAEKAAEQGQSPLEVMLDNMRHFQKVAADAEAVLEGLTAEEISGEKMTPEDQFKLLLSKVKGAANFRQMAHECARDAAPYMHPRLAAVEANLNVIGELVIRATKEQRDAAVNAALRSAETNS